MIAPHLDRSAVFSAIDRVVGGLTAAAGSSQLLGQLHALSIRWRNTAPARQRRAGGVLLLTAVAAHLALMTLNPAPPGWFWLILPGIAVAIGATLVASSGEPVAGHVRG